MLTYVIRRLVQLPFLLLLVSALVFFVLRLGPSPVDMATEAVRDPKEVERIRQAWGLDRPLYVQYVNYVLRAIRGDFGRSFLSNVPVSRVLAERYPATLELAILGMALGAVIGISL